MKSFQANLEKAANLFNMDPQTMSLMKSYVKPMAIGAGAGALGMGAADALSDHDGEQPGERTPNLLKSMALGGALGAGGGALVNSVNHIGRPDMMTQAYNKAKGLGPDDVSASSAAKAITAHPWLGGMAAGGATQVGMGSRVPLFSNINDRLKGVKPDAAKNPDFKTDKINTTGVSASDPSKDWLKSQYKAQNPGLSGADLDKQWDSRFKDLNKQFDESKGQVRQFMENKGGKGWYNRANAEKLKGAFSDSRPTPFDETAGWNRDNIGAAGIPEDNMRWLRAADQLGRDGINYMPVDQKVTTAIKNAWRSMKPGTGTHSDVPLNHVDPASMPRWMRGLPGKDMLGPNGVRSDMHIPESPLLNTAVGGKKLPFMYGRGKFLAGPAVGVGTGLGLNALHGMLDHSDAMDTLSSMTPEQQQAIYQEYLNTLPKGQ